MWCKLNSIVDILIFILHLNEFTADLNEFFWNNYCFKWIVLNEIWLKLYFKRENIMLNKTDKVYKWNQTANSIIQFLKIDNPKNLESIVKTETMIDNCLPQ